MLAKGHHLWSGRIAVFECGWRVKWDCTFPLMNHEIETTKILGVDTGFVQQSFGVQVQVLSRRRRQTATKVVPHSLGPSRASEQAE
jgi:hypothetical protein